ncbi:MAG: hypothetical protein U1C46_11465 [Bacteroidales bacterium]|nr:hypothetical protein [Bacteroidales bacterium]MDZ4205419.1 hypothetical protein [Bacteroidales bacterium]
MNAKKKIVVSYENLTGGVLDAIKKKYPYGYSNHVIRVTLPNKGFFHAITVDTQDVTYLVKVKVKLDKTDKLDEELFSSNEDKTIDDQEDTDAKDVSKDE